MELRLTAEQVRDLTSGLERRVGVVLAGEDERGRADERQRLAQVELLRLAAHPVDQDLRAPVRPHDHVVDQVVGREEREADSDEVREPAPVEVAVEPARDLGRLGAAEALVHLDRALRDHARDRRDQHERTGMIGVARGVVERDDPAEAEPEHDRPLDPEGGAEPVDVVGPALDPMILGATRVAATGPTLVEVDHLRPLGEQRPDLHLERPVVEAGSGVQQHDRRALAHPWALCDELGSMHVEEQPHVVDLDPHGYLCGATLLSPGIRLRNWSPER